MQIEFSRPLRQVAETKKTELGAVSRVSDAGIEVDVTTLANKQPRLLTRLRLVPEIKGANCRFTIVCLDFSTSASEVHARSNEPPFSDEEADSITVVGQTPWNSLHDLLNAAGEVTSR